MKNIICRFGFIVTIVCLLSCHGIAQLEKGPVKPKTWTILFNNERFEHAHDWKCYDNSGWIKFYTARDKMIFTNLPIIIEEE